MTESEKALYIEMGKLDFENGFPCIPVASRELMAVMEAKENNLIPIMEAWSYGWNKAATQI